MSVTNTYEEEPIFVAKNGCASFVRLIERRLLSDYAQLFAYGIADQDDNDDPELRGIEVFERMGTREWYDEGQICSGLIDE